MNTDPKQTERSGPKTGQFSMVPKIVNGGIAGITGVCVVFPLDLVKTRLQNQQIGPNGERMYKNLFDCFRKTYRAEGYFGMYKGSAVNIILVTPDKAIKLAANDFFRYHLRTKEGNLPMSMQMLAGGLAGTLQIVILTPMELLKIQMQDAGRVAQQAKLVGKTMPKISAFDLIIRLFKQHGIFGFYRGLAATALRNIPFSTIYFPVFATFNNMGPRRKDGSGEAVFWCSLLSGLAAGAISSWSTTPFDVVKTRLQLINRAEGERSYKGITDAFINIMKYEGPTAFFKGGACRVMVIAPIFGIAQLVYYLGVAEYLLGYDYSKV